MHLSDGIWVSAGSYLLQITFSFGRTYFAKYFKYSFSNRNQVMKLPIVALISLRYVCIIISILSKSTNVLYENLRTVIVLVEVTEGLVTEELSRIGGIRIQQEIFFNTSVTFHPGKAFFICHNGFIF
mmetsp:Transcript_37726/g.76310  ORF Transcript_37726/g.76310 Transcript_37726/m.76310 type:complete len:127 (-) Transcript_37726:526-906(-)